MKEKKWVVRWMWNGKTYSESFPTLLQAQIRYWKLNDYDASIHEI